MQLEDGGCDDDFQCQWVMLYVDEWLYAKLGCMLSYSHFFSPPSPPPTICRLRIQCEEVMKGGSLPVPILPVHGLVELPSHVTYLVAAPLGTCAWLCR